MINVEAETYYEENVFKIAKKKKNQNSRESREKLFKIEKAFSE